MRRGKRVVLVVAMLVVITSVLGAQTTREMLYFTGEFVNAPYSRRLLQNQQLLGVGIFLRRLAIHKQSPFRRGFQALAPRRGLPSNFSRACHPR